MRTVDTIEHEIEELKSKLETLEGRPTEVYTRIVGYYRSLRNWNRGKREEYNHRQLFSEVNELEQQKAEPAGEVTADTGITLAGNAVRFMYFYRQTCTNCPPVRSLLADVDLPGCEVDADTDDGMESALAHNIYSTPTVIFFDSKSNELFRAISADELRELMDGQLVADAQTA